jgi:hypothetical protein
MKGEDSPITILPDESCIRPLIVRDRAGDTRADQKDSRKAQAP